MGSRLLDPLIGLSLLALLAACGKEDERSGSAGDASASGPSQLSVAHAPAEPPTLVPDPLAAGNVDDIETLRKRLDELDVRSAQLRDRLKERGLGADRELGETLGELAAYREDAESELRDLEQRTGGAFTALEADLELMITDLENTLEAIARELEIELEPVELATSLAPAARGESDEQSEDRQNRDPD